MKIIGLSVDPFESHQDWSKDIEEATGSAPNYPMIADADLQVSRLYGMLPAEAGDTCDGRTAMAVRRDRANADYPQRMVCC